jgi:integrase
VGGEINATARIITVTGAKQGGTRRLDVKAPLIDYLSAEQQRQEELGLLGQWVLVGGSETQKDFRFRPLGQDSLGHAWAKMIAAERKKRQPTGINLDNILPYSLRHTYCTELLRAGVDIRTVQARMDHARLSTTQRYLHALEAEQHPTDALPY